VWRGRATGEFVTPEARVAPFDRAVLSWNANGPAAFELDVEGRRYLMGRWGDRPASARTADVDVDTLVLKSPATSFRVRAAAEPGTEVTLLAVATWRSGERRPFAARRSPAWGKTLAVPERSQRGEARDSGEICSPTSLAMVLEFHGTARPTREVCEGVYDHGARIYGNWPFNTAHAHRLSGLEAYVVRAGGFEELEEEIVAGRPVILSHRWKAGDLDGAPIRESDGHLVVVAGFTEAGDLVVHDPAAPEGSVRRVYKRRQVYTTWLERGPGIAYVVRARGSAEH
jgi:hypothetical protein